MNFKIRLPFVLLIIFSIPLIWSMHRQKNMGKELLVNSAQLSKLDRYAINIIDSLNPISIEIGREVGSRLLVTKDGSFENTGIILGGKSQTILPEMLVWPTEKRCVGDFHTHGDDDPMYANEHFSDTDTTGRTGISYLGTPKGRVLRYFDGVTMRYDRNADRWVPIAGPVPKMLQIMKEGK